jgi:cytochrome P450
MVLESILYEPPRPRPLSPVLALIRAAARGDGDLLSLLPAEAYRMAIGPLGYSRRSIVIVNAPELVRTILYDTKDIFPKNDLMVDALEPLVGNSIFVSSGPEWRRQRAMIDPAFSMMRVNRAFAPMRAAVDDCEAKLDGEGGRFSLDLLMSHLTADVICRTVFSTSLATQTAHDVFEAFTVFERSVAQVEYRRLIMDPAFKPVAQKPEVLEACAKIRGHLGDLVDTHLAEGHSFDDIATAVIAARDNFDQKAFTRKELLDQLGVLFLAGHETSASALTWVFFLIATQPEVVRRIRAEVDEVVGEGEVEFEHTRRMPYIMNVFRETLRLYPPITFLPRVALEDTMLGERRIKRGAMLMVAPWILHRHDLYWRNPHVFDPDRFLPERKEELTPGAYLPFGIGPRVCVGAAFAQTEAALIVARLIRRYDFHLEEAEKVRPAARLTTRPTKQIMCRVTRAGKTS